MQRLFVWSETEVLPVQCFFLNIIYRGLFLILFYVIGKKFLMQMPDKINTKKGSSIQESERMLFCIESGSKFFFIISGKQVKKKQKDKK